MKHWRPRIGEAADRAVEGARRVCSAWCSRRTTPGSRSPATASGSRRGSRARRARLRRDWHDHEPFLDVLADRVRGTDAHVVFTAHSLPERILAMGDPYKDELLRTSELVARRAVWTTGRSRSRARAPPASPGSARTSSTTSTICTRAASARCSWHRSASSPTTSRSSGTSTSSTRKAAELDLELDRIESLNDDPAFIGALAALVEPRCYGRRREHPQLSGLAGSPRARPGSALQALHGRGGAASRRGALSLAESRWTRSRSAATSTSTSSTTSTRTRRWPTPCARATGTTSASGRPPGRAQRAAARASSTPGSPPAGAC